MYNCILPSLRHTSPPTHHYCQPLFTQIHHPLRALHLHSPKSRSVVFYLQQSCLCVLWFMQLFPNLEADRWGTKMFLLFHLYTSSAWTVFLFHWFIREHTQKDSFIFPETHLLNYIFLEWIIKLHLQDCNKRNYEN